MPRPSKKRVVQSQPPVDLFKPRGIRESELEIEELSIEGYEALRLVDVEGLEQDAAAELMEISRPTLSRILAKAREIVAGAIVNGKGLAIVGGNYVISGDRCMKRRCSEQGGGNFKSGDQKMRAKKRCCESSGLQQDDSDQEKERRIKMAKIAVTAVSNSPESIVNGRFGRAEHIFIVTKDDSGLNYEYIDNSAVNQMGGGAGIKTAELVVNNGVDTLITGGAVGPKASQVLSAGGIKVDESASGKTVQDVAGEFFANS
ncbi:MAG: DUF134 domain-containing protein [Gammaproteobacteria bacterium]|nr:MAG: DUF134 domain-containing protein [Gammaproteobacteria bacterium]